MPLAPFRQAGADKAVRSGDAVAQMVQGKKHSSVDLCNGAGYVIPMKSTCIITCIIITR